VLAHISQVIKKNIICIGNSHGLSFVSSYYLISLDTRALELITGWGLALCEVTDYMSSYILDLAIKKKNLYIVLKNTVFNFIPTFYSRKAGEWKFCEGQNDISKWSNIV